MENIDIKRVCYHECCHAVVAQLFRQRLSLEQLVVNSNLVTQGQDIGALNVRGPRLDDEQDYTALAITLLAGVVGDNIYMIGIEAMKEKKDEILSDNTRMNWLFGGSDISFFRNNAFMFSLLYQINEFKLKEFCLRFLIDFLCDKEIWSMVEKLSNKLYHKDDMRLNEDEMEVVFVQIGLDEILNHKREMYQKQLADVLKFCQTSNFQ